MNVIDFHQLSLDTLNHEVGHAVIGRAQGFRLIRIIGDPHQSPTHLMGGQVDMLEPEGWESIPAEELSRRWAINMLAGRLAAEGITELGNTPDEQMAKELWASLGSPPGWLERCKTDCWLMLRRPKIIEARKAVSWAVEDAGGVLDGFTAHQIIDPILER